MATTVTREQVTRFLRDHSWKYDRKAKHVEIWKLKGSVKRLSVATRDIFPEDLVKITLSQGGFSRQDIEKFMREATKEPARPLC